MDLEKAKELASDILRLHRPDTPTAPSAGAMFNQGATPLVGTGSSGSPAVSASEILRVAGILDHNAKSHAELGRALRHCSTLLRQHVRALDRRQPQENNRSQPHPEDNA